MKYNGPIIDGHLHVETWFDSEGRSFIEGLDDIQNRRKVKALNFAALPIAEWGVANNIMAALYKLHNPSAFIHGGITYPEYPVLELPCGADPKTQYEELMAIGFDGMKNLETKPQYHKQIGCPVNLPFYEPYFAKLEEDGTHLLWHVCDPDTFWDINRISKEHIANGWYYGDGTYASDTEIYDQVYDVLKRHPKLKVTFAHFFFRSENPEILEKLFAEYPNVNIDITPGTEMYESFEKNHDFYRDFFTRYADRIGLGTDTYSHDRTDMLFNSVVRFICTGEEVSIHGYKCHGLDLPEAVCEKILYGNFARRVSHEPKPMDPKALKAYIGKYRGWIEGKALFELVSKAAQEL
ncbi:MAG: amidohydrolase family protein [Clostridia bacterium]|nr:amidohydrolase family protein [Clostridia bacterium]